MKSLCTMVVLGLLASSASAADISRSSLASIGLAGFVKMSDSDAMSVRGKHYHSSTPGVTVGGGISGSSNSNATAGHGSINASSPANAYSGGISGYTNGTVTLSGTNYSTASATYPSPFGPLTTSVGVTGGSSISVGYVH